MGYRLSMAVLIALGLTPRAWATSPYVYPPSSNVLALDALALVIACCRGVASSFIRSILVLSRMSLTVLADTARACIASHSFSVIFMSLLWAPVAARAWARDRDFNFFIPSSSIPGLIFLK